MDNQSRVRIYPQRTFGLTRPAVKAKKGKPETRRIRDTVRDLASRINRLSAKQRSIKIPSRRRSMLASGVMVETGSPGAMAVAAAEGGAFSMCGIESGPRRVVA